MSKRILLLIPNFGFGGAQRVLADHSRLLYGEAEVLEVVFNDWDEKRVYETGHPYESLEVPGGGNPLQRMRNFYRRIARLRQLKRRYRPDITVSHLEGADYISLLSGGKDKKIIVIHGSKTGDQNINGVTGLLRHKLLMPWLYTQADRIITVSKDIREEMIRHYNIRPEKIRSLPNFFDCAAIGIKAAMPVDAALAPLFSNNTFKLITFARLAVQKNLRVLFPLLAELKRKGVRTQLFILGDGELREPLLTEAAEYGQVAHIWDGGLMDNTADIFFLGYQAEPLAFLKLADLYVMSSLWEGFPMALCEAMASGIGVMAADCPTGPSEILDAATAGQTKYGIGPNGVLLPMITGDGDPGIMQQWVAAIQELAADRNRLKQMQQQGTERVQYYDQRIVGQDWLAAYLEL